MQIDKELILKLETLARLELSEAERDKLQGSLNDILKMVEKLDELDTAGVEPLVYINEDAHVLRDDVVRLAASVEAAGGSATTSYPEGLIHIWTIFPFVPEARTSMSEISAFVREKLAS